MKGPVRSLTCWSRGPRGGFTLVEALLATTVLAIVSASAALPFVAGVHQANEAARLEQAVALGQALMEEILTRPVLDPTGRGATLGPESGETTRNLFDNIDDFHGYSEQSTGLRDYKNQAITDAALAGFWRDVTVQYVTFANQQTADTTGYAKVTVRVWDGTANVMTLTRIAARED
ncbi:MAG TPA: type II secretion system protein [Phycisphaerae bacterium]|nr:type II secretion system protein [Phycisphaerae bacterium]